MVNIKENTNKIIIILIIITDLTLILKYAIITSTLLLHIIHVFVRHCRLIKMCICYRLLVKR